MLVFGHKIQEIQDVTGMSRAAIYRLLETAKKRGFNPEESMQIKDCHIQRAGSSVYARRRGTGQGWSSESSIDNVDRRGSGQWPSSSNNRNSRRVAGAAPGAEGEEQQQKEQQREEQQREEQQREEHQEQHQEQQQEQQKRRQRKG